MEKKLSSSTGIQDNKLIQAVVITDSYNDNFSPLTTFYPQCLMNLANIKLLDYTLQCLSTARVQEVIVFCSAFADKIKEYIRKGNWGGMTVDVVVSEGCRSFGDAMRDLDAKALIRGDFILIKGNVIGNLDLITILEKHKKIQKTDKGAAMTLLFKECGNKKIHPRDQVYVAMDSSNGRILYQQKQTKKSSHESKLIIPLEFLLERSCLDLRSDLLETGVSVCSVSVPPLFSDNFDFQTLDDFVRGLLIDEEILASTVYAHILAPPQYAASVSNWNNYHAISRDIIHRWTYPQVLDYFMEEFYNFRFGNIYLQNNVSLAVGSRILDDVVIAKESSIATGTTVSSSIIGSGCKVLANSELSNSHLFENVIIEENCEVKECMLGSGCKVGAGAKLRNCILGPGVIISQKADLSNLRLTSSPLNKDDKPLSEKAFEYKSTVGEEEDSDEEDEGIEGEDWVGLVLNPEEDNTDEDSAISSEDEDLESLRSSAPDDTNLFLSEVVDSLGRGLEDGLPCDNLVLEVNSSRYAYNVSLREVNYNVMRAVLSLHNSQQPQQTWERLRTTVTYFLPLLTNYIKDSDAMNDCLSAFEDVAEVNNLVKSMAVKILHMLYDNDVLTEEAILEWHTSPREESQFSSQLRKEVTPFIKWLQEADEESDSTEE